MTYNVTDEEKEELYSKYGKPPKREEPLEVERGNLVYVTSIGGPIYSLERGRVTKVGMSREDVEDTKGMTTDSGTIQEAEHGEYVGVRYGTATMHVCYVPIEYVLEKVSDECEWDNEKHQHRPL